MCRPVSRTVTCTISVGCSLSAVFFIKHELLLLLHPFNVLLSRTTWVSRYQKGKNSLDSNEARDDGVSGCSDISLITCKQSVPRCRQITIPTRHQSKKHWKKVSLSFTFINIKPHRIARSECKDAAAYCDWCSVVCVTLYSWCTAVWVRHLTDDTL